MQKFLPSRYSILIPLTHGRALAYNGLSGGFAICDPEERLLYESLDGPTLLDEGEPAVRALAGGGFIVREEVDELAYLEQQYRAHRYDPRSMILTIAPTLACNFGCDYCFQGLDKAAETMSPEVQDAIVGMVESVSGEIRHLHVAWYGGEPLVRRPVVEALSDRLIALCDRANIRFDAMIVSNGYKLDAETARSLHARRVKQVQVTLDGMPEHHDERRVLLSGKGTFERIAANLKSWIDEVPLTVAVRVNIDERNGGRIHDLIDHLVALGLGGKPNLKMYFAPIEAITSGCHAIADVTLSKSRYGLLEADLQRHAYEAGLAGLPYPPRFRGTCGAVRPRGFVVVPNGDLHKCWDTVSWPEKRVGTIFDVAALDQDERVQRWLDWTPFENETCRNCRILPVCAGACAFKFVHAEETRGEAAVLPCPSWKYNIKERLVVHAEQRGEIEASDYTEEMIRTDPAELCADVHVTGGQALPENMLAMLSRLDADKASSLTSLGLGEELRP